MRPKRERAHDATAEARGRIEIRPSGIRLLRTSKVRSRARMSRDVSLIARVFLSSSSRGFATGSLWFGRHTPAVLNQSHSFGRIDSRAVALSVLYRGA